MNEEQETYLARAKRIEQQVERWDMFAKLAPTAFLGFCFILLALGVLDFETAFYVGLVLFAFTAVIWWFWTLFSIRFLVKLLRRTTNNLVDVSQDLKQVKKDLLDEIENR